jgi:uncharacterized membrane protein YkoI
MGFLGATVTAYAAPLPHPSCVKNQDQVMVAVTQGWIQPFSKIQQTAKTYLNARIIKVELECFHNEWIYKLRLINDDNNIINAEYNAQTLSLININGKSPSNMIKVIK